MLLEAVYHRPKQNWAYAYDHQSIHLRIRTKRGDVHAVEVIAGDKYAWNETVATVPMTLLASDGMFDYWETSLVPPFRRLRYAFRLLGADSTLIMTERGFVEEVPENSLSFFDYPFINPADVFQPPAWVKDAVFYQIFPERFANGDPSLSPEGVQPWGGKPTPGNFFGGDLQGVMDHLDYLSELGINAIYFTPLFEATTNHKYDTEDYLKVDRHFGTNDKLKELVDLCHARGIRVLLDAVFNHSGRTFPPFVDVQLNGKDSKYADWFHVREWPLEIVDGVPTYETFAFEPLMPKLNTENREVKAYLLEAARYWIQEVGIDGWRLDVANEVDHQFWREFRTVVKKANPEAYILGEIWHDSMAWLQGDQFDAVMNYPFTNAALDFFAYEKQAASSFAEAIGALIAAYPRQVTEASFNLLGSHDTARLLTLCGGNTQKMKLAALFQLTFPGVPCIYYGDEVGIDGGYDPDCRKCMEWDPAKQDAGLLSFFREAIALRKAQPALRASGLTFVYAGTEQYDGGALAYARSDDNELLLIALNARPDESKLELDLFSLTGINRAGRSGAIIPFRGFTSAAANDLEVQPAALEDKAIDKLKAQPAAGENSGINSAAASWAVLFSGCSALPAGSETCADAYGKLELTLGGYEFVVLKRQHT